MMFKVFLAILETFIMFGIGAWLFHRKWLTEEASKSLSKVVLDVFFPFLTFATITSQFKKEDFSELWIMPVAGFLLMFFSFFLGWCFKYGIRCKTKERLGTFHHLCAVNNYVFLPIIVLENIYPDSRHVALLLIMNVGSTVGLWTVGIIAFQGEIKFKKVLQVMYSVNVVTVVIALIWLFSPTPIPALLKSVSVKLGNMAVPMMLIIIGGALYRCAGKMFEHKFDIIYLSVIRLIVIPVIIISLLKFFILKNFSISQDMVEVLMIVALMPAASSSVVFAREYGGAEDFAGAAIVITTLLSLGSIPLMLFFFA